MTSAVRASYPASDSARITPRWKASPVTPPAPSTSPTRVTSPIVPYYRVGMPLTVTFSALSARYSAENVAVNELGVSCAKHG